MPQPQLKSDLSVEDYLAGEKIAEVRHELIDGETWAMSGASEAHTLSTGNVYAELRQRLRGNPCIPFVLDMKLRVADNFYYPDVMVCCQEDDRKDPYYRESPILLIEVLSKSTRHYDRSHKAEVYRTLPSLQEYVLIEQDFVDVEVQRRSEGWISRHFYLGDSAPIQSLNATLPVSEIYDRVDNEDVREWLAAQAETPS
jgi:Uma2 family endonuclease